MTKGKTKDIKRIEDLQPDPANANLGTEAGASMVEWSLQQYGAARSIVADKNGVVGIGNKTMQAAADLGLPIRPVHTDGKELVVVVRDDLDFVEDPSARALAVADNRAAQVGLKWDVSVLDAIKEQAPDAMRRLFRAEDMRDIRLQALKEGEPMLDVPKDSLPNPRQLPFDVIYTLNGADGTCCMAVKAGLKYGISSKGYKLCGNVHRFHGQHEVCFIDNDYFGYNHEKHVSVVKELRPKYATVRDVMSAQQCEEAGIAYFPLEQVLDFAEELNAYAENVIVIPKYDCIDRIPEKFMLGYSVPSSHGSTPLPVSLFKGRRVHLLGGSWKAQLAHMAQLGEDVVSLDNNYICFLASILGNYITPEGRTLSLTDIGIPRDGLTNVRYVAIALSLGAMGIMVNRIYGRTNATGAESLDADEEAGDLSDREGRQGDLDLD